jgi:hypothetical protein
MTGSGFLLTMFLLVKLNMIALRLFEKAELVGCEVKVRVRVELSSGIISRIYELAMRVFACSRGLFREWHRLISLVSPFYDPSRGC